MILGRLRLLPPLPQLDWRAVSGHLVLVVDDDPSLRLLCRVNLALEGFRVLEAGTVGEARAAITDAVDVVLLDVHLGNESGIDLLHELRRTRPTLPVAMLTGSADLDAETRGTASAVIPKPFQLEELVGTVRRLAPSPDVEAQLQSAR